jgi:hypothetical protein
MTLPSILVGEGAEAADGVRGQRLLAFEGGFLTPEFETDVLP